MVIYLQMIHLLFIYKMRQKIKHVAHNMVKLFEFFTMYVLFP